jgi:hypothetical protein
MAKAKAMRKRSIHVNGKEEEEALDVAIEDTYIPSTRSKRSNPTSNSNLHAYQDDSNPHSAPSAKSTPTSRISEGRHITFDRCLPWLSADLISCLRNV